MVEDVRKQIQKILVNPSTVTEIKNKLPKIKSFGTVAYHLKQLEKDLIVTKFKDKKKRGQPTTYQLLSKKVRDIFIKQKQAEDEAILEFSKQTNNKPYIEDEEITEILKEKFEKDGLVDYEQIPLEAVYQGYAVICYKLTPKGQRLIKKT